MSFNRFAAGKKRYGMGGSIRPTSGPVDPTGYIKRELARQSNQQGVSRVGNDGRSDTRSGLAHNAVIRNNLANNVGRPNRQAPVRSPGNGPKRDIPKYTTSTGRGANAGTTAAVGGQQSVKPIQPTVQVASNGQLNLPYDSEYFGQVLAAQQNFDAEMMNLGFEEQDANIDYQQFIRELEEGYVDRKRGTLNNAGASGMLQSSLHSTGINEDARDYTQSKTDSETQRNNFLNQLLMRKNGAVSFFNQNLQQASTSFAERFAANQAAAAALAEEQARQDAAYQNALLQQHVPSNGGGGAPTWQVDSNPSRPSGNHQGTGINNNLGNNIGRGQTNNNNNRPPKPGPNYEWDKNKGKWVKK